MELELYVTCIMCRLSGTQWKMRKCGRDIVEESISAT